MKLIYNDDEFEKFYFYKKSKPTEYPKKYPCVAEHVFIDYGGLSEHVQHRIFYVPESVDLISYLRGMLAYKGLVAQTI